MRGPLRFSPRVVSAALSSLLVALRAQDPAGEILDRRARAGRLADLGRVEVSGFIERAAGGGPTRGASRRTTTATTP